MRRRNWRRKEEEMRMGMLLILKIDPAMAFLESMDFFCAESVMMDERDEEEGIYVIKKNRVGVFM